MRLLTLSIAACCLLTACAHGPTPMPGEPIKVLPQANLTAPPQPLPPPASGQMRDLEENHREVAKAYHLLASQMCLLLASLEIHHDICTSFEADR